MIDTHARMNHILKFVEFEEKFEVIGIFACDYPIAIHIIDEEIDNQPLSYEQARIISSMFTKPISIYSQAHENYQHIPISPHLVSKIENQ